MKKLMNIMVVVAVAVAILAAARIANPCFLVGHDPMAPAEYGCRGAEFAAPIILCRAEFQVCRRCKLMYLGRVEAETGKKP